MKHVADLSKCIDGFLYPFPRSLFVGWWYTVFLPHGISYVQAQAWHQIPLQMYMGKRFQGLLLFIIQAASMMRVNFLLSYEKSHHELLCVHLGLLVEELFFAPGNGFWETVILRGTKEGTSWMNIVKKKPTSHLPVPITLCNLLLQGLFFSEKQQRSKKMRIWKPTSRIHRYHPSPWWYFVCKIS